MQIMLKQTLPKVMPKEKTSKIKHSVKSEKGISDKKLVKNEKTFPSKRLNPVVILNRLPEKYAVSNTSSLSRTSIGKESKSPIKNRGKKKGITWRANSWNEADEEWSNEGSLSEEASSFLNRLVSEGEEGQNRQDEPEVDVIDGVKFLSFLHEPDTREFSCFHPFYHPFFSDYNSENSLEESLNEDFKQKIIPTKTRDITQIKGWRKKLFGNCNEYGMPSEGHESEAMPDLKGNDDEDNSSLKDLYESDHENLDDFYPAPGTCDEGEIIFDDVEEEIVKDMESKNNLDDETLRSHFELSKVESKAANAESAFQSKGLEEFLGQKSELRIGLLSQYDPNVKVIEKDSPILAVGTLKKDDYVPPWKKMMERQRKRMELLAASKNKRKENTEAKNVEDKPKDTLQTELGNKIVWLDDDSESDEVDKLNENVLVEKTSEKFEGNEGFQPEENHSGEVETSLDQIEEVQTEFIQNTTMIPEPTKLEACEIKIEPSFEDSTKENEAIDSNSKKSSKKKLVDQGNSPNSSRAKREKKLSWKMLSSLEMDEKFKEVNEEKRNKHKSPRILKTPVVEEPIRISLKHSPDRSSWVINNVISESDFSSQQSKRRRKIRNYSYIFATEEGVFKDKLPEFEIVNQTVWSRSKILEKELIQFLADWRNPLVYVDALQRYQCKTYIDEAFPDLTEEDALMACRALNRLQSSPMTTNTAKVNLPGPTLYPKLTNYSELTKKKVSRFEELQNSLKFMDLDPALIPRLDVHSSTIPLVPTELNRTKRKPSKNHLNPEYEQFPLDEDSLNDLDTGDSEFNLDPSTSKRKKLVQQKSPRSPPVAEKNGEPILLDDSNSSHETNKKGEKLATKEAEIDLPSSSSDDTSCSQEALPSQLVPVMTEQQPVAEKNQCPTDEIIELPTPNTTERRKNDEEVAVVFKKRPLKDPLKKRKKHNRELQKTLILKSFRQVISGNTVLKSFIVANTNITSKAKDNMSLGLCAVGLTLNKGPDVKNDIFLLYGRINDHIYNEAIKKSFYEEQHGIETHHTVVPIVLEITKAAMKSSNDLKLVRIPLKGRALIDNQLDSVPLMIYPVATKPPEEDMVEYSKHNDKAILEVPSPVPKASEPAVTASQSTGPNDVSILKEVRRPTPEKITLSSGGEESPKKKIMLTTSVIRGKRMDDKEDEIDILTRSDEETLIEQPIRTSPTKKTKFMPLNRTEPIRRIGERVLPRLYPRPQGLQPHLIKNSNLLSFIPTSTRNAKSITLPNTKLPATQMVGNPPVFLGTFGASRALATLKTFAEEKKTAVPPLLSPKDKLSNGKKTEEVSLINAILSDQSNGTKKDLKLLTTKQLSEISEIVDSVQSTEPVDLNCDHELKSAAEAAWQIVGPCVVRRVKLRNGNVVYVYKSCQAQQIPGFSTATQQQNFCARLPGMTAADAQSRQRKLSSQSKEKLVKPLSFGSKTSVKTYAGAKRAHPVVATIGSCIGAGIKIISPPVRGLASSFSEASKVTSRANYETNQTLVRPKTSPDFGFPVGSNLPRTIVSPIKVQSPPPYPSIETTILANTPPSYPHVENASVAKPQPIIEEIIRTETKTTAESKNGKNDIEIFETPTPAEEIGNDMNTSVWIGTDGEPCYVMRLDNDDDTTTPEAEIAQEESKIPTIMECFPISEEEFQRCDASNIVQDIT